jgi:hypothetical protein
MSPDERASIAQLERLRQELADDRRALEQHAAEARALAAEWAAPVGQRTLVLAGATVHFYFTALESILERVARALDQEVPGGERWHLELLSQGTVEVPGVRPAVLPRSLLPELSSLLGFRHFFRHGYAAVLEEERVHHELERVAAVDLEVAAALDAFDRFLEAAVAALVEGDRA